MLYHKWWTTRDSLFPISVALIIGVWMFEGYSLEMEVGVAPWTLDLIAENQLQAEQVHKGFIPTGRDYSYALFINISLCAPSTPSASQFLLPLLVVQTGDSNSWTNWNFLCSVFKFSEEKIHLARTDFASSIHALSRQRTRRCLLYRI